MGSTLKLIGVVVVLAGLLSQFNCDSIDYRELLERESKRNVDRFTQFMKQYDKEYISDELLYKSYQKFVNNEKWIINRQLHDTSASYTFTQFADLTPEEFQDQYLTPVRINEEDIPQQNGGHIMLGLFDWLTESNIDTSTLPKNFDWRTKGIITPPKAQKQCGSCWAFVTTGMLEAQLAKKTGILIDLSEQQLIDCDRGNKGCKGGLMTQAYKYLSKNGIQTTATYGEYQNRQLSCRADTSNFVANVTRYYQISKNEKAIMKELYENGPIAVGINGEHLQFYDGGIFNPESCSNQINHAVLIVGYGETEDGTPYWIIKNQWGKKWGEEGYFKLIRGQNKCGINTYASIAFIH